jgi:inosine/xanthosine triphosphate pyrophosphatase family protein/dephospho-CoA kinase
MRELTFFTTNQTKLAHARYVAEGRQIQIKGFRQRTYHADYTEPRLASRDEILLASYNSAKEQLSKARYSGDSHPFILEDTSVRIEALSNGEIDIPGVDIKYWMEDQTFPSVDRMLREAGNDRRASVRSDILLHVPANLRSSWNVDSEFVLFSGTQSGKFAEAEHLFDSNLVYPWLDNRSFNKWFVPDGANLPIGALPVVLADQLDFRRKSLEQLFEFLEARRYFSPSIVQFELPLDRLTNIILCGYTCSGKTTASQHLARRFGYLHVEASDFMHLAYYYRHGYQGPTAIGDFAERALAEKPTIAAERIVDYMREHLGAPIVVSGFRAPQEVAFLEGAMKSLGKTFSRCFIRADQDLRYDRLQSRGRPGDDLTIDAFRVRDLQQQRMGLDTIDQSAETLPINNGASLEAYLLQVDSLAGDREEIYLEMAAGLDQLRAVSEVGLEDAILIALLSVWESNEARNFYSTTEIARLISMAFSRARPKYKDNVSRYFNQDFYVYYEISTARNGIRVYRLSNTGYGMAIQKLRTLLKSV